MHIDIYGQQPGVCPGDTFLGSRLNKDSHVFLDTLVWIVGCLRKICRRKVLAVAIFLLFGSTGMYWIYSFLKENEGV